MEKEIKKLKNDDIEKVSGGCCDPEDHTFEYCDPSRCCFRCGSNSDTKHEATCCSWYGNTCCPSCYKKLEQEAAGPALTAINNKLDDLNNKINDLAAKLGV